MDIQRSQRYVYIRLFCRICPDFIHSGWIFPTPLHRIAGTTTAWKQYLLLTLTARVCVCVWSFCLILSSLNPFYRSVLPWGPAGSAGVNVSLGGSPSWGNTPSSRATPLIPPAACSLPMTPVEMMGRKTCIMFPLHCCLCMCACTATTLYPLNVREVPTHLHLCCTFRTSVYCNLHLHPSILSSPIPAFPVWGLRGAGVNPAHWARCLLHCVFTHSLSGLTQG